MGERDAAGAATAVAKAIGDAQALTLPLILRDLGLSPGDVQVLKDTIAKGANDAELAFFLRFCKSKALDPFSRQVHLVKRWDPEAGRETMAIQTGIDGYRVIAERTDNYEASEGPLWCAADGKWCDVWLDDKNPPKAARFIVHRKGRKLPIIATARFSAYAQKKKDQTLTRMWATMGAEQLAKCAEALALRRAFPEDLASVHVDTEMEQADNPEAGGAAAKPAGASRAADLRERLVVVAPALETAGAAGHPSPVPASTATAGTAPASTASPSAPLTTAPAAPVANHGDSAGDVVDAEYDEGGEDPGGPSEEDAADALRAPDPTPVPPPVAAAPATSKGATVQQAERIRDLLDRLNIPRSSPTDSTATVGPRLAVLRSAAKSSKINKVSDLTFEQADAAIAVIAAECQRMGISITTNPPTP